jgi:ATP phosphoribosyltransferase
MIPVSLNIAAPLLSDRFWRAGVLPFGSPMPKCRGEMMTTSNPTRPLTFAIPKGRILDEALPVMARAGVVPEDGFHDKSNRSLSFATTREDMRLIRVRAFDVATFVAHGAAQVGIVGSDVIEEFDYADLYAPVDLDIGHCRLSVARMADDTAPASSSSHLRVATKYPNLTRRHFERQGIQAECVKLNGAMELAPSLGLARQIVDLVSTGATLKQNGLVETDRIVDITARLIVNRAALKTDPRVAQLVEAFRSNAEDRAA